ncbi:unnamed protein product [Phytomonas sp. Hart1]|nr:unnamed protein product [Phytomonas sp. Hart1]|eukprot:CCW66116.1 unnamed protein product [Phytomonas sp. isolate Hart1]
MNSLHVQEVNDADNMGNEANTQLLELQEGFMKVLTNTGLLGKLKAQLRAVALALLRGDPNLSLAAVGPTNSFAQASIETQIALLIINDFLAINHLTQTAGVLEVEAGTSFRSNRVEDQVKRSIATLSGEGTMLERLIHLAIHRDHVSESHLSALPSVALANPEPKPMSPLMRDEIPVDVEENPKTLLEPIDSKIHYELMQYEESIPYSDVEECLKEDLYAIIESL